MDQQEGKYLTFSLGKEDYGISILKVKEIIGVMDVTSVPKTPEYIKGVINLRGTVIPLMDLRLKLGMEETTFTERTCIIVVEININNESKQMGVLVDSVSEVLNIEPGQLQEALTYGAKAEGDFIEGMGKINDKVIMLLNIEKIVTTEEIINLLDNMNESPKALK